MKIVYFGTSSFACPVLKQLHLSADIDIALVVSRPSRKAGRGRKQSTPPVALLAEQLGLPLVQPEKLKEIKDILIEISPLLMVSASYGGWLPEWLLTLTKLGVVNIHPSLLPRHRGAAPIIRSILEGDPVTGISFMVTDNGWDTGDVLDVFEYPLSGTETAGELEEFLANESATQLLGVLKAYSSGQLLPTPQTGPENYAEKVTSDEAFISWNEKAENIRRQILAFNPVPGARTFFRSKLLKIYSASKIEAKGEPGRIISVDPLVVACLDSALQIIEIQPQGKKRMAASDFVRGYRIQQGDRLGD